MTTRGLAILSAVFLFVGMGPGCGKGGLHSGGKTCTQDGQTYKAGESFKWDCNTCTCMADGIAECTLMACLGTGGFAPPAESTAGGTLGMGGTIATGGSAAGGAVGAGGSAGQATSSPVPCALSSNLTFGYEGGKVVYQDSNRLTASTFTITRSYLRGAVSDGATSTTCSPKLPACVVGSVSVATIDADLADADVQMAFASAQASGTLYGMDERPVDGPIYTIALDDGRTLLVGAQCALPSMNSCRNIPAGLLQLTSDLMSLAGAMAADPACQGL